MKQAKDNEVKGLHEIKDKIGKFEGSNIKRYLKHYYEIMDSYGVNTKDKISCFHRIFKYELKPQLKLIEEEKSDNWEDFQEVDFIMISLCLTWKCLCLQRKEKIGMHC